MVLLIFVVGAFVVVAGLMLVGMRKRWNDGTRPGWEPDSAPPTEPLPRAYVTLTVVGYLVAIPGLVLAAVFRIPALGIACLVLSAAMWVTRNALIRWRDASTSVRKIVAVASPLFRRCDRGDDDHFGTDRCISAGLFLTRPRQFSDPSRHDRHHGRVTEHPSTSSHPSTSTLPTRMAVLLGMLCVWTVACAQSRDNSASGEATQLRAHIDACEAMGSPERTQAAIVLEPTESTPAAVSNALPLSRLWSFEYRVDSERKLIDVGGFPIPEGSIDLLPRPESGASVDPSPPPMAHLPVTDNPELLTLTNLLLGVNGRALIKADNLMALEGKSVDTPFGLATVARISSADEEVTVTLQFQWRSGLRGGEFQPKGSLQARISVGGDRASAEGPNYALGDGQSLAFLMAPAERDGQATLALDEFGLLYPGPISVDPSISCG